MVALKGSLKGSPFYFWGFLKKDEPIWTQIAPIIGCPGTFRGLLNQREGERSEGGNHYFRGLFPRRVGSVLELRRWQLVLAHLEYPAVLFDHV